METKADFRKRVQAITGVYYQSIPIAVNSDPLFEGPILAKWKNVYVVGKAYCFNVTPEGHEEYYSFVRVVL